MLFFILLALVSAPLWFLLLAGITLMPAEVGIPVSALAGAALVGLAFFGGEKLGRDFPGVPALVWRFVLPSTGSWAAVFGLPTFYPGGVMTILGSAGATVYGLWLMRNFKEELPSEAPTRPYERRRCIVDEDGVWSC